MEQTKKPVIPEGFTVKKLGKENLDLVNEIVRIFQEGLGTDYITPEKITETLKAPTGYDRVLLAGFIHDKMVAVLTVLVNDPEEVQEYHKKCGKAGTSLPDNNPGTKTGTLESMAVTPSHRRKGLGTLMLRSGIHILQKKGCFLQVATSWDSGEKDTSQGILQSVGFHRHCVFENYWEEESLELGYSCPTCGHPPCTCKAIFYVRETPPQQNPVISGKSP